MVSSIRMLKFAGLLTGMALYLQPVWSQKPGGTTSGTGGAGNNSGAANNRYPPSQPGPTQTPTFDSMNGNIYLSGKVALDDGTPPPEPVTIERVCNGAPRAQAYTDQKGRFSFQVGQTQDVLQDASEDGGSNPVGPRGPLAGSSGMANQPPQLGTPAMRLDGCDLRAVLAGFRSDSISLGRRHAMDDPNVGTIILHRLGNVEGAAISLTSLQAPKDARRAYEKGTQDLRKNKPAEAASQFQKAVETYPKYAAAWFELGKIQQQNEEVAKARQSFASAVSADPQFTSPYIPLIDMAAKAAHWDEVSDVTSRLLKLDAVDYPMAYFYHAVASLRLGDMEAAEKSARGGEKVDTAHGYPKIEQLLATILAQKKDYAGAAEHLRSYLALSPNADDAVKMRVQLAELDRMSGASHQASAAIGKDNTGDSGRAGPP